MSNRFGYQGDESERHVSRYARRKLDLERQQEAARSTAAQAPTIDIPALKTKLRSQEAKPLKRTEQPNRPGAPHPSDFTPMKYYPDED
jgi:hypothetical protein